MNTKQYIDWLRKDGFHPEKKIQEFYQSLYKIKGAIDLGANNGFHTIGIAKAHPSSRVYAVEANETTFSELCTKVRQAELQNRVVEIFAAVQDDQNIKEIEFNNCIEQPGRSGVHPFWFEIPPENKVGMNYAPPVRVPATTIDQIVDKYGIRELDFIKADLEGGEYSALRGGLKTMKAMRPIVVFERSLDAEKHYGYSKADWFQLFHEVDYKMISFDGLPLTDDNYYDFWYVFSAPTERHEEVIDLLTQIRNSSIKDSE